MRGKATGVNAQEMRERLAELLRCTERGSSFVMTHPRRTSGSPIAQRD